MARPREFDDLKAQKVIASVKKGLPRDTAAKLAGIAPSTLYKYLALGRDGDPDFVEFAERVKAAEANAEEELLGLIRDAARGGEQRPQWQAAAWLLERRMPKKYALRKPDVAVEAAPTLEEAERLIEEAAKLKAAQ